MDLMTLIFFIVNSDTSRKVARHLREDRGLWQGRVAWYQRFGGWIHGVLKPAHTNVVNILDGIVGFRYPNLEVDQWRVSFAIEYRRIASSQKKLIDVLESR